MRRCTQHGLVLLHEFVAANAGLVTLAQLRTRLSRDALTDCLRAGALFRVCHGVYAAEPPSALDRLRALDMMTGKPLVGCLGTAASLFGFDTENDQRLHVLDPAVRLRSTPNVVVHQRVGAPLRKVQGRLWTAPDWTAVEVGRTLRRPRALATLDAALRSGFCTPFGLQTAVEEQRGRRGIVAVRELLALADPRAESPMESEARLVFHDGGVPAPELQFEIVDLYGELWRVDFAWPEARIAAEYDSKEWHANPDRWKRDRIKAARLGEMGWQLVPFVVDDVRRYPVRLCARVSGLLIPAHLAG